MDVNTRKVGSEVKSPEEACRDEETPPQKGEKT